MKSQLQMRAGGPSRQSQGKILIEIPKQLMPFSGRVNCIINLKNNNVILLQLWLFVTSELFASRTFCFRAFFMVPLKLSPIHVPSRLNVSQLQCSNRKGCIQVQHGSATGYLWVIFKFQLSDPKYYFLVFSSQSDSASLCGEAPLSSGWKWIERFSL